jgi:hypothetical protein
MFLNVPSNLLGHALRLLSNRLCDALQVQTKTPTREICRVMTFTIEIEPRSPFGTDKDERRADAEALAIEIAQLDGV